MILIFNNCLNFKAISKITDDAAFMGFMLFIILLSASLKGFSVQALRHCESNVCLNGGICEVYDGDRSFRCLCPNGFEGFLCESEKVCSMKCLHNGKCVVTKSGKQQCKCSKEFSGELCEIASSDCQLQGCSIGERCMVAENGRSYCVSDPCIPNLCQNNATCVPHKDTFECICTSGFDGALCGNDIDECAKLPCKNDAICVNTLGSFTCLCKDGFRGTLCEENTPCDPNPCYNDGICNVLNGRYHCSCQPGFTSELCQERTEENCNCVSAKQICVNGICKCPNGFMGKDCDQAVPWFCIKNADCNNGGTCVSSTGGCLCAPGYTGMHCEHTLECTVQGNPCIHGKCIWSGNETVCSCEVGYRGINCEKAVEGVDPCSQINCNTGRCEIKGGTTAICLCPEGSSGKFCEIGDICKTKPCKNGGKCFVDSTDPSGFKCICNSHFTGEHCEVLEYEKQCGSNQCSTGETCVERNTTHVCVETHLSCGNCVHSVRCIEIDGNAICVCENSWTGPKCDQRIEECLSLSCASYETCRNENTDVGNGVFCGCAPGLTGPECTVNTAVTFHATTFFLYQSSNIVGSPTSNYTLKFTFRTVMTNTHIFSTENILGEVQFALSIHYGYLYGNFSGSSQRKLLPFAVNDDHWYTVLFSNTDKATSLELREGDFVLTRLQMEEQKSMGIYWTRIGKGRGVGFKGCIRELFVNGELVNMLKSADIFGITEGCQRSEFCSSNPCQNNGVCYDEWDDFRCDCKKPFLPPYCIEKTDEVTFGHDNITSLLEFDTGNNLEEIKLKTEIDFFVKASKPNGTLLYLGEKNSDDVGTFITLEIVDGSLNVRTRLGGKKIYSRSVADKIDDSKLHSIRLVRERNNFTIWLDGAKKTTFDIDYRFDHPLLADTLILGSSENLPPYVFVTGDYFKGILQDLRINGRLVVFTTLPSNVEIQHFGVRVKEENVLQGTVYDDICSLLKPCVNGKCSNTFNGFECECEYFWTGNYCNERDHCALASCGANVACTNYGGGYVCSLPATFVPTSFAKYKLKAGIQSIFKLFQITFLLRTRSSSGQIMYLNTTNAFISILLKDGFLDYEALLDGNVGKKSTNFAVNDGFIHAVKINESGLFIDGKTNDGELLLFPNNIFETNDNISLTIGQRNTEMPSFDGCLEGLQIGMGAPISFFSHDLAGSLPENATHFVLTKRRNVLDSQCYAEEMCGALNPCKNGAFCRDLWNMRVCECRPGFTGTFCEVHINKCENHACKFGSCVDGISNYSCQCLPGYGGQFCDKEIDLCKLLPCLNGGNCTSTNGKYHCDCQTQFVGSRCQTLKSSKCTLLPCENGAKCNEVYDTFECECPLGFDGALCDVPKDFCNPNPCKNGAKCISKDDDFECLCSNGYEGRTCDDLKDYCTTLPCLHGQCTTLTSDFLCHCEPGWNGPQCNMDIDECMRFPCEHDGNCTNIMGSYRCACDNYHLGERCEIVGSCMQRPCGLNGDCIQKTATTHLCVCRRGYTGDACDIMIDYCSPDPCQNGATCQRFIGAFSCMCLPGFTGERCDVDIDDCIGKVCQNGGRCIDRINGYECDCEGTGYHGTDCSEDIDECARGFCIHGICTNLIGSYNCTCNYGYIGDRCSVEDPCLPDDLNRTRHDCIHGTCINSKVTMQNGQEMTQYECECEPGYSGQHCIHYNDKRKAIPVSYVAGPVLALMIVLFMFGCALFSIAAMRGRRAMQGTYSPSHQESSAARMPMSSVLKSPPEERLI